jgi:hypothetical protein
METQGTAYGLIHDFSPSMVTNRGTAYFFAHPMLLHFWVGASAFVSDDLDRLEYYYLASEKVRDADRAAMDEAFKDEWARFTADPVLLPSRTPNIFLGVFVIFPMAYIVYGLSGSRRAALGACVLYATLPEVYVRSAYGGYMALANFLTLSGAYFYLQDIGQLPALDGSPASGRRPRWLAAVSAFLGGWTDQKTLLLPAGAGLHALGLLLLPGAGARPVPTRRQVTAAAATVLGAFLLGWATFIVYGLLTARGPFLADHLKEHVVDRLTMRTVHVTTLWHGAKYPSILGLWEQFSQHAGWIIAAAMFWALAWAAPRIRRAEGVFFWWVLVGGIGFSLVDWRITKHLAQLLPAMVVLTGVWWASREGRTRAITGALLVLAIAWNIWRVAQLMNDFSYLAPTPLW